MLEKHLKDVQQAVKEGRPVDLSYNVARTGVAVGKEAEKEAEKEADRSGGSAEKRREADKAGESEDAAEKPSGEGTSEDRKEADMEVDAPAAGSDLSVQRLLIILSRA